MTFEEALKEFKNGKKIRRQVWYENYYFPDKVTVLNEFSLLADDWELLEEKQMDKKEEI